MWIGVSGSSAAEVADSLSKQNMFVSGSKATKSYQVQCSALLCKRSFSRVYFGCVLQANSYTIKTFNRYIPTAAILGGMSIGETGLR
jgi:hypothetical protein